MIPKIREALSIYRRNFLLFAAMTLVVWVPVNLVVHWVSSFGFRSGGRALVFFWGEMIFEPLTAAAIVYAVYLLKRGEKPEFLDCMQTAVESWPRLATTWWPAVLCIFMGLVLLIAPGLFLWIRFTLIAPVVVVEGLGWQQAWARSWKLTAGRQWPIFATGVVYIGFSAMIEFGMKRFGERYGISESVPYQTVTDSLCDLFNVILTIAYALFYCEARFAEQAPVEPAARASLDPAPGPAPIGFHSNPVD